MMQEKLPSVKLHYLYFYKNASARLLYIYKITTLLCLKQKNNRNYSCWPVVCACFSSNVRRLSWKTKRGHWEGTMRGKRWQISKTSSKCCSCSVLQDMWSLSDYCVFLWQAAIVLVPGNIHTPPPNWKSLEIPRGRGGQRLKFPRVWGYKSSLFGMI